MDSSSLLSEDVAGFGSSPCAKSLVALIYCLFLQHFAKWFLLSHRVHYFQNELGIFFVRLDAANISRNDTAKHKFSLFLSTVILSTSCLIVTSVGVSLSTGTFVSG